jgi:hypothetical protein
LLPVCSYRLVRMMLAVGANEGVELRQFDINTEFLTAISSTRSTGRPPRGWEHLAGGPWRVLCLECAVYVLRQAPSVLNQRLASELIALGFVQRDADPSFNVLPDVNATVMTIFCVDDV